MRKQLLVLVCLLVNSCVTDTQILSGVRLGTFPKPDFTSKFLLRAQDNVNSFREIEHGLGVDPFLVKVYAESLSGDNAGFCFEGFGSSQTSADQSHYGGLIYAYNSVSVRVWAPTTYNGYSRGRIIYIQDGWGGEKNAESALEAIVVIKVWATGPEPSFQTNEFIDLRVNSFYEIKHRLGQLPERVAVKITPEGVQDNSTNPNGGFWFNGIGVTQNANFHGNYGGIIFAYNEYIIRLWAPDHGLINSGCVAVRGGWGDETFAQHSDRCNVSILVWVHQFPLPTMQTEWLTLKSQQGESSFMEIAHNLNYLPEHVLVQVRATSGNNFKYVYEAVGSAQIDDEKDHKYGGVIFGYDKNRVRLWAPSRNDTSKKGYVILVKDGWGKGYKLQKSDIAEVRVLVFSSKCDDKIQTTLENGHCLTTAYESHKWLDNKPWSTCSSICNNGTRTKTLAGCLTTSRENILSCDFENDLCGWMSSSESFSSMAWKRDQGEVNGLTGPKWGYPRGSFYAYTDSQGVNPNSVGILTTSSLPTVSKCVLYFHWNMFGKDIGKLEVDVLKTGYWVSSGWSMTESEAPIIWRAAFIDLRHKGTFSQIRFKHTLPSKDKCGSNCFFGNAAIDNIRLECESSTKTTRDVSLCADRITEMVGCEKPAVEPAFTGPAYSTIVLLEGKTYVQANGSENDTIAGYEFMVYKTARFVLWKHTFAVNETNNEVSFRIDDGDWIDWGIPKKFSHALWTQYVYETFLLSPGLHTVTLRQKEKGFNFDKLILAPVRLETWTELGMQSKVIPDSFLTANPQISNPASKYGRLHSKEAWCSADHNPYFVWFEIKLPSLALVTSMAVQGGQDIKGHKSSYWVTTMKIKISLDGEYFTWYRNRQGRKTFFANTDARSVVMKNFSFALPIRAMRIYPLKWMNWICMRVELYGMYITSGMCSRSGQAPPTSLPCVGERDCGSNAVCKTVDSQSIPKLNLSSSDLGDLESCHCLPGYHGDSCQHYGCTPNPCYNSAQCKEDATNFICLCTPGFQGYLCNQPCPSGKFGANCTFDCNCSPNGTCNSATGKCTCPLGYYGPHCDTKCPLGHYGFGCSQVCQCHNRGSCHHVTGHCDCASGWTGMFCTEPCDKNRYGDSCAFNCSCSNYSLGCERTTGHCVCPPGYMGSSCDTVCPDGKYGQNCSHSCLCHGNAACSKTDGTCSCPDATTGVLCTSPCPLGYYGNSCSQKCDCSGLSECDSKTGSCVCAAGWYGSRCTKPCLSDYWGLNCTYRCSCSNGAKCNHVTGHCTCSLAEGCLCNVGWTGEDCKDSCPMGTWGRNCKERCKCKNGGLCDKFTGQCTCLPGYVGAHCEKTCGLNHYGSNCTEQCMCNASHSTSCDHVTGQCQCHQGYHGNQCQRQCSGGTWGVSCGSHCQCTHGSCNPVNGFCVCDAGWQGALCDELCDHGMHGQGCLKSCACNNHTCDAVNGACKCTQPWNGIHCDKQCGDNQWGVNCTQVCNCQHNGSCSANGSCECLSGWTGNNCENTCLDGFYGYNCTTPCSCGSHGNGSCDPISGRCYCLAGYEGERCTITCPAGRYGDQCLKNCSCFNGEVCDPVTGVCDCSAGWRGSNCSEACPLGTHGLQCKLNCQCIHGNCYPGNGTCACEPGYHGSICELRCANGMYGADCSQQCTCKNAGRCDHVTGACECPAGWTGATCDASCSPGTYGINCSQSCQCSHSSRCDPATGQCRCSPGWAGPTCSQACPIGRYGINCIQSCSCSNGASCDPVTGGCTCTPGWTGGNCTDMCTSGWFGMQCQSRCDCHSNATMLSQECHHVSGKCQCELGYLGYRCTDACPHGFYGSKCLSSCQCQSAAECSFTDGTCTCLAGYHGKYCDKVCPEGYFGSGCNTPCNCTSGHTASCNKVTGQCNCLDGYHGLACENQCEEGRYGFMCGSRCNCQHKAHCHHVYGTCECLAGFMGPHCNISCPKEWFGPGCKQLCLCENGAKCDRFNGDCACTDGYVGSTCTFPCPSWRYGMDCMHLCSCEQRNTAVCSNVDGKCSCKAGFKGKDCTKHCEDGFYGPGCVHTCPECSHHVTGACLRVDGSCQCSPGYYGRQCLDDCVLGYYGPVCMNHCDCLAHQLCSHVDGICLDMTHGKFSLILEEYMYDIKNEVRQRDIKLGVAQLLEKYYDSDTLTPTHSGIIRRFVQHDLYTNETELMPLLKTTPKLSTSHDYVARIVDMEQLLGDQQQHVTRVTMVVMDNNVMLNGSKVLGILQQFHEEEISEAIAAEYYSGKLYHIQEVNGVSYLPWIIGGSVVFVFLIIIIILLSMRRRDQRNYSPKTKKVPTETGHEFEMKPCIQRGGAHLLAFDNPYYDVLAAMGVDDDVEEDYYNPLYDDVSLYSHSDQCSSDESYNRDSIGSNLLC